MARGQIRQSPGKGKKIQSFPFDVEQEADGRVITRKVMIDAYLQSRYDESSLPPKAVLSTQFYMECVADDGASEQEYGTDLNACLKAMRAKLDRRYKISWKRWLMVKVESDRIHDGTGAGVTLSWSDIERGVTLDGDVLMRRFNVWGDFNNRWEVSPWPEVFKDKKGRVVACIEATDANVKALEAFAQKLNELRKTLAAFVAPDRIEETLAMITSGDLKLIGGGS